MTEKADKDSGLHSARESEKKAKDPEPEQTGGMPTTDPTFADGAMEQPNSPYPPEPKS